MADYTHYAAVTEEWTKFEKTWSPPTPPAGASVQQIRDLANAGAAKNFAAVLGRPGKTFFLILMHLLISLLIQRKP